ncbi:hypothetical protein, partial [Afipia sp. OHSU_II-C2]|uniref:hypothetical protein n=2 Tax=unclassified Afipia TaxID=2642050 RepID=UPI001955440F
AMERRKAMRFRNPIASQAMPEAKRTPGAPRGAPCPSKFGAELQVYLARCARTNAHAFRWREWGKPHTRMLFEN